MPYIQKSTEILTEKLNEFSQSEQTSVTRTQDAVGVASVPVSWEKALSWTPNTVK